MATTTSLSSVSTDSPTAHSAIETPSSRFGVHAISLGVITILAAFLRLRALTVRSFWLDEGFSMEFARLPWPQFVRAIWSSEVYMLAYFFLLRLWVTLGSSEGFVRGLSVLFSVATVPAIFFLGARLFDRRAALLAALLLAINAYHIRYAQEARSYALLAFFAVLATWLFARNLQEPSSAHWGIYAVVCALATYSHFFGGLLVPAHAISLLSWRRNEIPWRKYVRSLLVYGAMIFPIAIYIISLPTVNAPVSWVPPLQPDSLLILGIDFSGVYGRALLAFDVLAIGIAALGAAGARRTNGPTNYSWRYTLIFSWLVAPVMLVAAISFVTPTFLPRYLILCLPSFLLLVAVGISQLRPAVLAWGLLFTISVCSILGDLRYYKYDFDMTNQDWRGVTAYVFDHAKPGDSIFFCESAGESPFEYYSGRQQIASLRPITLRSGVQMDGNRQKSSDPNFDGLVNVPGTNLRIAPPGGRVWLVLMFLNGSVQEHDKGVAVSKWLSSGRQQVDERDFTALKVMLFDRPPNGLPVTGDQASVSR